MPCLCEEGVGDDPQIMGLSDIGEVAISIDSQHGAEAVHGLKEEGECQPV